MVGLGGNDDAAVYRIDDERALVFTTDFFTPIVEDAFDWGRIAAANALSDVYAMGGRPLLCLNLAGWPRDVLPFDLLGTVLEGAASVARDAGALVVGGHTVDDPEPKVGMAVVGLVHPGRVVTNARAAVGDVLLLTKPLGTGVITTGLKNEVAPAEAVRTAVEAMVALNDAAAEVMVARGAHAATDVTGYGLLGHLGEMLRASGVAAEVHARAVPILPGAMDLAAAGQIAGGTRRNRDAIDADTVFDDAVDEDARWLLCDAQTSGGLLIAAAPDDAAAIEEDLRSRGVDAASIGTVDGGAPGTIRVIA